MFGRFGTRALLAALVVFSTASVEAAAVDSYGNLVAPGVYFGSGNPAGDWTISTENNVEVALRAKTRFGPTIDGSSGTYHALGGSMSGRAKWNYELSVNTQAGGGGLTLQDVFVILSVDTDPSAAFAYTDLDVLSNWGDNDYWSSSGERSGSTGLPALGEFGVQLSQNAAFGDSGFGFIPGPGLYGFQLSVYQNDNGSRGGLLAQTQMQIQIPEPGSLALIGVALVGLAASRRRKVRR